MYFSILSALRLVARRHLPWHMLTARCRIVKTVLTNLPVGTFVVPDRFSVLMTLLQSINGNTNSRQMA
jgi:hypothetical protein